MGKYIKSSKEFFIVNENYDYDGGEGEGEGEGEGFFRNYNEDYNEDYLDYNDEYGKPFFTAKLSEDDKRHNVKEVGKNITWYGDPNQMIIVPKESVEYMSGNQFNTKKLFFLRALIETTAYEGGNVEIECDYAACVVLDIQDILEEQTAYYNDEFMEIYDGKESPASTGDEDLDSYIGNEDYIDDTYSDASDDVLEFMNEHKLALTLTYNNLTREDLVEKYKALSTEDEDDDSYFQEYLEYETNILEAKNNKDGDFGKLNVQIRNGNHRALTAIATGEDFICVNLVKEDIIKYKGYYNKV